MDKPLRQPVYMGCGPLVIQQVALWCWAKGRTHVPDAKIWLEEMLTETAKEYDCTLEEFVAWPE